MMCLLLQDILMCLLEAMPSCLMACDSPALLKTLEALLFSRSHPNKSVSFMAQEAFAVPIYQVSLTSLQMHSFGCAGLSNDLSLFISLLC